MELPYLKDPNTKKKSFSRTASWISFNVVLFKFLMSGVSFFNFTFEKFDASEFTLGIGAVIALHNIGKLTDKKKDENERTDG